MHDMDVAQRIDCEHSQAFAELSLPYGPQFACFSRKTQLHCWDVLFRLIVRHGAAIITYVWLYH